MKRIAVTGGSGRLGQAVVRDLQQDYEVVNIDVMPPPSYMSPYRECDLSQYGEAFAALHACDAVIHLASDPRPDRDHFTGAKRFKNNTLATYNVFNAAVALGVERVIWASSITIYGFPFQKVVPHYFPVDEAHPPIPETSYGLSKVVSETLAAQYNRLSHIPFIGLQLSHVQYEAMYADYPKLWEEPKKRLQDLWSYVDYRDAVQSIRQSLLVDISGAENFLIVADDSMMNCSSADLIARYFPTAPTQADFSANQSLFSNEKAKTMLGYAVKHSWRNYISESADS